MKSIVANNGKITIDDISGTMGVGVGFEVGEGGCEGFGVAVGVAASVGEEVAGLVEGGRGLG